METAEKQLKHNFKHMQEYVDQTILHNKHNGGPLDANNAWGKSKEKTTKIMGVVKTL